MSAPNLNPTCWEQCQATQSCRLPPWRCCTPLAAWSHGTELPSSTSASRKETQGRENHTQTHLGKDDYDQVMASQGTTFFVIVFVQASAEDEPLDLI